MKAELTYESLKALQMNLIHQQQWWGSSEFEVKASWLIQEDTIIIDDGKSEIRHLEGIWPPAIDFKSIKIRPVIIGHPYIMSRLVAQWFGYETGLNMLQRYLHQEIDSKFKRLKK